MSRSMSLSLAPSISSSLSHSIRITSFNSPSSYSITITTSFPPFKRLRLSSSSSSSLSCRSFTPDFEQHGTASDDEEQDEDSQGKFGSSLLPERWDVLGLGQAMVIYIYVYYIFQTNFKYLISFLVLDDFRWTSQAWLMTIFWRNWDWKRVRGRL